MKSRAIALISVIVAGAALVHAGSPKASQQAELKSRMKGAERAFIGRVTRVSPYMKKTDHGDVLHREPRRDGRRGTAQGTGLRHGADGDRRRHAQRHDDGSVRHAADAAGPARRGHGEAERTRERWCRTSVVPVCWSSSRSTSRTATCGSMTSALRRPKRGKRLRSRTMVKRLIVGAIAGLALAALGTHLSAYVYSGHRWPGNSVPVLRQPREPGRHRRRGDRRAAGGRLRTGRARRPRTSTSITRARTTGTTIGNNGKNEVFFRDEANGGTAAVTYWWYGGDGKLLRRRHEVLRLGLQVLHRSERLLAGHLHRGPRDARVRSLHRHPALRGCDRHDVSDRERVVRSGLALSVAGRHQRRAAGLPGIVGDARGAVARRRAPRRGARRDDPAGQA